MAGLVPVGIQLVAAGVAAFQTAGRIVADTTEAVRTGFEAAGGASGIAANAFSNTGNEMRGFARGVGSAVSGVADLGLHLLRVVAIAGLVVGAIGTVVSAVTGLAQSLGALGTIRFAAEVERDFAFIRAVLQATGAEMDQLRSTAASLASNIATPFRDIVGQLRELGRAGISIDEITASVGKLTASLAILARGEASPTKIAEAIASGLKAFQATGASADDVAKSILGVANATRLSIPEVINAFNKAAPTAGIFGATTEQLGAFIALIGSAGIRGEEAGTGIRNFFLRLSNPSREAAQTLKEFNISLFDVAGSTRPIVDVIGDLQKAFGQQAVQTGKITEANRAYSLSQIFQTRTAAVAALAIIQGTDAYNEYLAVIRETDPILQAAAATDNLLDKLLILKNRGQVLADTFGGNLLPGLRSFVDRINDTVGDVSNPQNRARQIAGALGQSVGALFTGSGIGAAADKLESQFGATVGNVFESLTLGATKVRDVIVNGILPATGDLLGALGRLAGATFFNPTGVKAVGDTAVSAAASVVGLIRVLEIVVDAITSIIPAVVRVGSIFLSTFSTIASAVGRFGDALARAFVTNPLAEFAKTAREEAARLRQQYGPLASNVANATDAIALAAENAGRGIAALGQTGQRIQAEFEGITITLDGARARLEALGAQEARLRQIASATRTWKEELAELQRVQLSENGPDVQDQINNITLIIAALENETQALSGLTDADDAVANARAKVAAVTEALNRLVGQSEGVFDDQAERGREEVRIKKEIETSTKRLGAVYEDLGRSAAKGTREVQDRIDDLVTKTNRQFRKLEQDIADRMSDINQRLAEAASDAKDAFDFESLVRSQRTIAQRGLQDFNTFVERQFQSLSQSNQDAIQDRDLGRQRELQQISQFLDRQLADVIRTNSEINENTATSASRRFEDIQRAFSRTQQQQVEQLQQSFDVANTLRSRVADDAERKEKLASDLARAKTAEERAQIRQRFDEESRGLVRSRGRQDEDTKIRLGQQKQLQNLQQTQQEQQVQLARSIADQELVIRRNLATQERNFRVQQEFLFLQQRFSLEDQFTGESRRLRNTQDIPQAQGLQDRQRDATRQIEDTIGRQVDDFFRIQQQLRDEQLRERGAQRERDRILRDAEKQGGQIDEQFLETLNQTERDSIQKQNDLLEQARNTADDIQRNVGVNFPALQQFRGVIPAVTGAGAATISGAIAAAPTQLQPPEFMTAAAQVSAAFSTGSRDIGAAIQTLVAALNEKAQLGGVNVQFDDAVNNGIMIGDSAVERFGSLVGNAVASAVAPRAGR